LFLTVGGDTTFDLGGCGRVLKASSAFVRGGCWLAGWFLVGMVEVELGGGGATGMEREGW
jgi:hypothetical protein